VNSKRNDYLLAAKQARERANEISILKDSHSQVEQLNQQNLKDNPDQNISLNS
jgi:hypothetical protein